MMTGTLICYDGRRLGLPPFLNWKLKRTGSVPCDSFEGACPWDGGAEEVLADANRLILEEDGQRRFTGVLDEYELVWDETGGILSVSGRGMAALLLDNEARGQDYQIATLADILRDHVTPYGITVKETRGLPAVPGFSVETGSSEWQVLYSFACYHGGVEPWFDVWGQLYVTPSRQKRQIRVDDRTGITGVTWRDRRYGVYSEVLVQDRGKLSPQRVTNEAFLRQGGQCRRVITMPGKSTYQTMRYSGQYQLDQSARERLRVELTVPGSCFCEPGDTVTAALTAPKLLGTWTVLETESVLDERGSRVKVTLVE